MNQYPLARLLLTAALLLAAALFSATLQAAPPPPRTFTVTSTADTGDSNLIDQTCDDGTGHCTLRAAIVNANNFGAFDTIQFNIPTTDPGYNAQTHIFTINLGSALPDLSTEMNINGPGANKLTMEGGFRVTTTGTVNISNLTIANGGGIQNGSSGTVNISSCILRGNVSLGNGGAVNSSTTTGIVAITNSTLENNSAFIGGAIFSSGTLNITGSIVRHNFAVYYGGGVSARGTVTITNTTIAENRAVSPDYRIEARGGGIDVSGTVTLINSTISGNSVRGTDAAPGYPTGGALAGGVFSDGNVNIINCTFSANSAEGGNGFNGGGSGRGGAIVYAGNGTFNLSNSTISGNSASRGYGAPGPTTGHGGGILKLGTFNIKSTIVANNSADVGPDLEGSFASKGFNLIGKKNGSTGFSLATDKKGTIASPLDPKLGPLQNNGGLTQTMALLSGSPAIDKGTSVGLTGNLTTDQRGAGFPRTIDKAVANAAGGDGTDIGAFEVQ